VSAWSQAPVAVVGIGATEFSKRSGRTELTLAAEAVRSALEDAGLDASDVDGLVTFTMDTNPETEVARALGIPELRYFDRIGYGGGAACATVQHAAMAVMTGMASTVVCYRAFNERSGNRFGLGRRLDPADVGAEAGMRSWYSPFGLITPAAWVAMFARRYMHSYGATSEDFGKVTVADRRHAATNPDAWFYQRPITLEEHQASRWIVEPLRLLDCCQESDGGVALVVAGADRAGDLRQPPALIRGAAQGSTFGGDAVFNYYHPDLSGFSEAAFTAAELWRVAGIGPEDVDVAMIYENFSPVVFYQLEAYGFCGRGEAKDFIADGHIGLGGRLPVNTNGGLLGEGYIHGMNNITEAVRQIRGTAANQVHDVGHVLCSAGRSAVVLGAV